ncbi:hypothetical protein BH11PSE5_BH11PSE5_16560 [soil metagenome]
METLDNLPAAGLRRCEGRPGVYPRPGSLLPPADLKATRTDTEALCGRSLSEQELYSFLMCVFRRGVSAKSALGSGYPNSMKSMIWWGPTEADGGHFSISIHRWRIPEQNRYIFRDEIRSTVTSRYRDVAMALGQG